MTAICPFGHFHGAPERERRAQRVFDPGSGIGHRRIQKMVR